MIINWIGAVAALATFLGVWLGHVAVRKIEYSSATVWLPVSIALILGLACESAAAMTANDLVSAGFGIFGITLLWDGLEFFRQQKRVRKGHARANPQNPRHNMMKAQGAAVTTIDWLDRDPVGEVLSEEAINGSEK